MAPPTATRSTSPIPTVSTSAGIRTTTSALGSARTSASAPTSRVSRSASCSGAAPSLARHRARRPADTASLQLHRRRQAHAGPLHAGAALVRTRLCDTFGIEFPIFAFSHCRDVVAAVSKAGGVRVLGALAFPSPQALQVEHRWIDEHPGGEAHGVGRGMALADARAQPGGLGEATLVPTDP